MTDSAACGSENLSEAIVQTIDQPLLILRADLKIENANTAFCDLFKVGIGKFAAASSTTLATASGTFRSFASFWSRFCRSARP